MKDTTEKTAGDALSRRQFSQMFLMLVALFGMTNSAPGIDRVVSIPPRKPRRARGGAATATDVAAVQLGIDFPVENAWQVSCRLGGEDYSSLELDPDDVTPRMHRQLLAAKAAPWGTPVVARVAGDAIAILCRARYFAPGEPDDRDRDETDLSAWRLEWFGDGIKRVAMDNTSWWPKRLAADPEWSKRERAFVEAWLKENDADRSRGINSGCGLAQDLMLSTHRYEQPENFQPWLSNRERKILATFVQWLGTNCGQSFLSEVHRKGGIVL